MTNTLETGKGNVPCKLHVHPGSPSCVRDENDTIVADHCTPEHSRLFAAAPELLAACEMAEHAFNVEAIDPLVAFMTIEKLRAVIARAKGSK